MSLMVESLTKSFEGLSGPVDVLKGVTLEMQPGQSLAIQGPSGSGKSTLLHIIGTLDVPSGGSVRIDDRDPFQLKGDDLAAFRNTHPVFVFQDHYLLPQFSVLENVLLPTIATKNGDDHREHAGFLLERVGLSHRRDHRPAELSGGERQRAAIARALINRPALLLCDEPTGNLDVDTADTVADLLFELHREQETIMIAVTHSSEFASRFDRRLALSHGILVEG